MWKSVSDITHFHAIFKIENNKIYIITTSDTITLHCAWIIHSKIYYQNLIKNMFKKNAHKYEVKLWNLDKHHHPVSFPLESLAAVDFLLALYIVIIVYQLCIMSKFCIINDPITVLLKLFSVSCWFFKMHLDMVRMICWSMFILQHQLL